MNKIVKDPKKAKVLKIITIVACVFLVLALLVALLPKLLELLQKSGNNQNRDDLSFFPVDYETNILEDEEYLSLDRAVRYRRYGHLYILEEDNIKTMHPSAAFLYDYLNCIMKGDYENYPYFYTEELLNHPDFNLPEKFTPQGLYDIDIELLELYMDEATGEYREMYTIGYRIFENNGTYRRDMLPGEKRTKVYEIKISDGQYAICSMGYSGQSKPTE